MAAAQCRIPKDGAMAPSWSEGLKSHEHEKRRFIHGDFLKAAPPRLRQGDILMAERAFNPLSQRWLDDDKEAKQRDFEKQEQRKFLNRARDMQIMRNGNTHIISMERRTAPLEKKKEGSHPIINSDVNTMSMPSTMVDYNIVSNLPHEIHHWAKPEERPLCAQRNPSVRKVQACQLRDFNIVTNRYKENHEDKAGRDARLNALESTHKYREKCCFDPVSQSYNEKEFEERARCCDDAREVEVCLRQLAVLPPTNRIRLTAHYDMITHQADEEGAQSLQLYDALEHQRKSRYKARHVDEHTQKMRNVTMEDVGANQRHEQVAHERWLESTGRGYNLVTNRVYGDGPKFEKVYEPFTTPNKTLWEMVEENRSGLTPPASARSMRAEKPAPSDQGSKSARETLPRNSADATPARSTIGTPRTKEAPAPLKALSQAGSAALNSSRSRPPLLAPSGREGAPPPPPPIPGSPVGSVYSQPKK
jgi:hypothetical protein